MSQDRQNNRQKMGLSRRDFIRRSALAGGILLTPSALAACADEQTGAQSGATPNATSGTGAGGNTGGTTVRYMAVAEPVSDYIRDEMVPIFREETGINVEVDTTDYVSLHDKQVLELQGDRFDVYQVDQVWLQSYARSGFLEPLGPQLSEDLNQAFYDNLMQICSLNDQQWTLPLSAIPVDYYYRQDVLETAGLEPADTWDDVLTIAKETMKTDQSGNVASWGFAVRGERGNPITWTWLPMLWAWGGQIFDDNMQPVYNNEQGVASVEYFKELNTTSPPGWQSAQDVAALMQQGECSQTTLMSVYNGAMDDPEQSTVVDQIGFAEMPRKEQRASILGMWTLGIGANSPNKDAAWQFVEFLSRPENARQMALAGAVGATQPAIYEGPDVPRYFPVLGKVLEYAQPPPLIPQAEEWFLITGTELQNALSGAKAPQQAMDDAASQVSAMLADSGSG